MSGLPSACDLTNPSTTVASCQLAGGGNLQDPCNVMNQNTSLSTCQSYKNAQSSGKIAACQLGNPMASKENCIAAGGTVNDDPCNILNPNANLQACGQQNATQSLNGLKLLGVVVLFLVILVVMFLLVGAFSYYVLPAIKDSLGIVTTGGRRRK